MNRPMSMPAFFDYLHDHTATTELAKALAEVAMRKTCGAGPVRAASPRARLAS